MPAIDIKVPDIGDFKDVAVIEVLVKPGDKVAAEQSLVTVESDKASMEIPSSHAGVVKEMKVKVGDKVSEGSVLLSMEAEGAGQAAPSKAAPPPPPPRPSPGGGGREPAPQALRQSPTQKKPRGICAFEYLQNAVDIVTTYHLLS